LGIEELRAQGEWPPFGSTAWIGMNAALCCHGHSIWEFSFENEWLTSGREVCELERFDPGGIGIFFSAVFARGKLAVLARSSP
jgi:hypothetical protein